MCSLPPFPVLPLALHAHCARCAPCRRPGADPFFWPIASPIPHLGPQRPCRPRGWEQRAPRTRQLQEGAEGVAVQQAGRRSGRRAAGGSPQLIRGRQQVAGSQAHEVAPSGQRPPATPGTHRGARRGRRASHPPARPAGQRVRRSRRPPAVISAQGVTRRSFGPKLEPSLGIASERCAKREAKSVRGAHVPPPHHPVPPAVNRAARTPRSCPALA